MIQPVSGWPDFTPSTTTTPTPSPSSCTTKWIIGALFYSHVRPPPLPENPRRARRFGAAHCRAFAADPFSLGVASGYPAPDGVVLWTRLGRQSSALVPVPVRWEVAADEAMKSIDCLRRNHCRRRRGPIPSMSRPKAFSPERWYWYRFSAGDAQSAVGRTRTAPRRRCRTAPRLRFAFASCQQYEQGYFGAYRHMVADAPDLVAFLGDYIYESTWGRDHVRKHDAARTVHARRLPRALRPLPFGPRSAGGACRVSRGSSPGTTTRSTTTMPTTGPRTAWSASRSSSAAPPRTAPTTSTCRCRVACARKGRTCASTRTSTGAQLARFYVLDDRQYRSWHACPRQGRRGGSNTVDIERCARAAGVRAARCSAARRSAGSRRARRLTRGAGT